MISTAMLAAARVILDENTESFWTDASIYAALADGQNEVIAMFLMAYKLRRKLDPNIELPEELRTLLTPATGGIVASYLAVPAGFLYLVNASWDHDATGGEVACRIVEIDRSQLHREENTFLAATATDPIAFVGPITAGTQAINFRPVYSTSGSYIINYLKTPTDIASGQNATIPVHTHTAIVDFAVSRMLEKDQRVEESQIYYNMFLQKVKTLLGV